MVRTRSRTETRAPTNSPLEGFLPSSRAAVGHAAQEEGSFAFDFYTKRTRIWVLPDYTVVRYEFQVHPLRAMTRLAPTHGAYCNSSGLPDRSLSWRYADVSERLIMTSGLIV